MSRFQLPIEARIRRSRSRARMVETRFMRGPAGAGRGHADRHVFGGLASDDGSVGIALEAVDKARLP